MAAETKEPGAISVLIATPCEGKYYVKIGGSLQIVTMVGNRIEVSLSFLTMILWPWGS